LEFFLPTFCINEKGWEIFFKNVKDAANNVCDVVFTAAEQWFV